MKFKVRVEVVAIHEVYVDDDNEEIARGVAIEEALNGTYWYVASHIGDVSAEQQPDMAITHKHWKRRE